MSKPIGFDCEKYLDEQRAAILERVGRFEKLYIEFGGKLIFDYHAARVLPGFDPNAKIRLLQKLKEQTAIILCVYAGDIERRKMRADFGITYDSDTLKLIDDLRSWGLDVSAVVMTRFHESLHAAVGFKNKLERRGLRVYTHPETPGYPQDVDLILSNRGFGAHSFVETDKPLVAVIAPGPNSGKMSTCLSQLFHEHKRGVHAGYAKFETFPIWNIPLKHPVNAAYEAATADLHDINLIDPFHLEAYGKTAINYNRDVALFPLLKRILTRLMGQAVYQSPTDMGVNRAGFAIVNDAAVREAACQEVIRRYFRTSCEYALGAGDKATVERVEGLMEELALRPENRVVVEPARRAAAEAAAAGKGFQGICCGAAVELQDGTIVTGKNSALFHAASSLVLNAIKQLAGIPDKLHLLPPAITQSIAAMKENLLNKKNPSLDVEEMLIALSISAMSNPAAQMAMEKLPELKGCEVHLSHIPPSGDETGLRRLGVNLTSDPLFPSQDLYVV
jgi:uncharacterized protein (UPF0371 family)